MKLVKYVDKYDLDINNTENFLLLIGVLINNKNNFSIDYVCRSKLAWEGMPFCYFSKPMNIC